MHRDAFSPTVPDSATPHANPHPDATPHAKVSRCWCLNPIGRCLQREHRHPEPHPRLGPRCRLLCKTVSMLSLRVNLWLTTRHAVRHSQGPRRPSEFSSVETSQSSVGGRREVPVLRSPMTHSVLSGSPLGAILPMAHCTAHSLCFDTHAESLWRVRRWRRYRNHCGGTSTLRRQIWTP